MAEHLWKQCALVQEQNVLSTYGKQRMKVLIFSCQSETKNQNFQPKF